MFILINLNKNLKHSSILMHDLVFYSYDNSIFVCNFINVLYKFVKKATFWEAPTSGKYLNRQLVGSGMGYLMHVISGTVGGCRRMCENVISVGRSPLEHPVALFGLARDVVFARLHDPIASRPLARTADDRRGTIETTAEPRLGATVTRVTVHGRRRAAEFRPARFVSTCISSACTGSHCHRIHT